VRFEILGPLRALDGDHELNLGGPVGQRILATLLLSPNRIVSHSRLIEVAWPDDPPATSRRLVQNRVAALRNVLTRAGSVIETHDAGYRLRLRSSELDRLLFDDLVERGRAGGGNRHLLREALSLWRGPALVGLTDTPLARDAAELEEKRLVVLEECLDLELAAGAHDRVVDELAESVAAHPHRERLVAHLMLALHRGGQQAAALAAYRALADRLADELGIDPGPELRRRYEEIRQADAPPVAAAEEPAGPTPSQLPVDVFGFTGREPDLARLDGLLAGGRTAPAAVISAIAGMAGVGKTALAVHWAHRVRASFPDGQLYVNLRGYSPMPALRPIDALSRFLRALGVAAEQVPTDIEEAAELYRSLLAERRVLVVLDNGAGADQVRPLLPPPSRSLAVVTSRDALRDLDSDRITLGVLSGDEARSLLARLLGAERLAAEPAAADDLARLCAYLPLALRIAAANIGDGERLADYAAKLSSENRLAALDVGDDEQAAVRGVFDLSYAALSGPAQRMYRLLGLVPGPDVTVEAASSLADVPVDEAEALIDELATAHLINEGTPGRFAFHDLVRLHAAGHAGTDEDAVGRLYEYYIHTARAAVEVLQPGLAQLPLPDWTVANARPLDFADETPAAAWLDAERANLVVAVSHAAEHGPRSAAWLLATAFGVDLRSRGYRTEAAQVGRAGLAAAEAGHDLRAQVVLHNGLSSLLILESQYPAANEHLTRMLEISREIDWPEGISTALSHLAVMDSNIGRPERALGHIAAAIALDRRLGWNLGLVVDLQSLALVYWELGRLREAVDCHAESLSLGRDLDNTELACITLGNLAEVYCGQGRLGDARDHLEQALKLARNTENHSVEADFLGSLAMVDRLVGDHGRAFELAHAGLALAREVAAPRYELRALNVLACLNSDLGRWSRAAEYSRIALHVVAASDDRYPQVQALIGLASAHGHLGRYDEARAGIGEAIRIAEESGYRMLLGQARTVLAEIELHRGAVPAAIEQARAALAIQRDTGHRPGEADALGVIALGTAGADPVAAEPIARQACALYVEFGMPAPGRLRALADQQVPA
jgi:DNA-binding SARP family transcriptional activator